MDKFPTLEQTNRELIRQVLVHFKGDITKSAQALGISRQTIYRHIHNYDLKLSDLRKPVIIRGLGNTEL